MTGKEREHRFLIIHPRGGNRRRWWSRNFHYRDSRHRDFRHRSRHCRSAYRGGGLNLSHAVPRISTYAIIPDPRCARATTVPSERLSRITDYEPTISDARLKRDPARRYRIRREFSVRVYFRKFHSNMLGAIRSNWHSLRPRNYFESLWAIIGANVT